MRAPEFVTLSSKYNREEDFSKDLSDNIHLLGVGKYDESETEAIIGTRRADIVAKGGDGVLVIECQFGRADWDHWGRLEAYARLRQADLAVLVAEDFEDLMAVTCELRNGDSKIGWYLIKAQISNSDEIFFQIVEGPKIDIQTERPGAEFSQFWAPIRKQGIFAGRPVPDGDSWIQKSVSGVAIQLVANKGSTIVRACWPITNTIARDACAERLKSDFTVEIRDINSGALIEIQVLPFGTAETDRWDEIREKLLDVGGRVYRIVAGKA